MIAPISTPDTATDRVARHPGTDSGRHPVLPHRPNPDAAAAQAPTQAGADRLFTPGGLDDKQVDSTTLCRLLSLLADKTRLRILWLLADGERAVGAMTAELGLPQPTVSHHLAWLRTMHLVSPRRAGKNVFYALGRAARAEPDGTLSLLTADMLVSIGRRAAE